MRAKFWTVRLSLVFSAFFAATGCDEGSVPADLADVVFEGVASDEAWLALDEAPVTDDPMGASWLFAPTTFSRAAAAPAFTWTQAVAAEAPRQHQPAAPRVERSASDTFARGLSDFFSPVAHAHQPPVTGNVYRLIFTVPGQSTPLRVLTTNRAYTPTATTFAKLSSATGPISLELVHVYLVANRVMEGPFRLPAITITPE